jgi:hypothetical protein
MRRTAPSRRSGARNAGRCRLSLAAVLVLAVGVTLRMQQGVPGNRDRAAERVLDAVIDPGTACEASGPRRGPASGCILHHASSSQACRARAGCERRLHSRPCRKLKKDQAQSREADDLRASRNDAATPAQAPVEEKRAFADQAERNVASPAVPAAPAAPPPTVAAAAPVTTPAPAALARDRQEGQSAPALRMQAAPQAKTEAARAAGSSMDQAAPARPAVGAAGAPGF